MLTMRSIVGPVVGTTFYSNAFYERENYYVSRLSQDVDMLNPLASERFARTRTVALAQGQSYENAQILASLSIKGQIQKQAALAALKEIAGWTIWAGIGCVIIVLLIPYRSKEERESTIAVGAGRHSGMLFKVFAKQGGIREVQ